MLSVDSRLMAAGLRGIFVEYARNYAGKLAYRDWGNGEASTGSNATCAEFIALALRDIGVRNFPEHCWRQWAVLQKTGTPEIGDLVFAFADPYTHFPNHVGIYAGEGVLHCSKESGGVTEEGLAAFASNPRYKKLRYASLRF